ncbi:hypothetical protein ES703_53598 [subsurface metagenome]
MPGQLIRNPVIKYDVSMLVFLAIPGIPGQNNISYDRINKDIINVLHMTMINKTNPR